MPERGFLGDILRRIGNTTRGRRGTPRDVPGLLDMCAELLGDKGEVSGIVHAMQVLDGFEALDAEGKRAFFDGVAERCGVDEAALSEAIARWSEGDGMAARAIHDAAEPKSQELIRRLNQLPGATPRLVGMRADLLEFLREAPGLKGFDRDFQHLLSSWFNRGFLEIRRIDWSTPAVVLEKIIQYEAVHEITGWDDLRQRVADPDRRLFAFFHPAMPGEPLIFVEVALMQAIPGAIAPILSPERDKVAPEAAKVAVFYSISNCQKGLRGISFGNFLIKQVVVELQRELPGLTTFVTLSPVPGLRRWADEAGEAPAAPEGQLPDPQALRALAAQYLTQARRPGGTALDPVAHFHLGNGAELHAVHAEADLSPRGIANSWGVMVNYLYDSVRIEDNHQAYATGHEIAAASAVRKLAASATRKAKTNV